MTQKKNLWIRAAVCASLIVMVMIVFTVSASAETDSSGQWTYRVENGGAVITGYVLEPEGELDIPDELDGHPVIGIGKETFGGCYNLTGVVIPESVLVIGNGAFTGCINLAYATLPEGLTSIPDNAFNGCLSLAKINIPADATSIGGAAFMSIHGLVDIIIPAAVTSIGDMAFVDTGIQAFIVTEGSYAQQYTKDQEYPCLAMKYDVVDGGAEITSITYDERFSGDYFSGNLPIPGELDGYTVTAIREDALAGVDFGSVSNVTVPASVTSIGQHMFSGRSLTFTVEEGSYAEQYAKENGITVLWFGENKEWEYTIEDEGIRIQKKRGDQPIGDLVIPDELDGYPVIGIGMAAFRQCGELTSVIIPDGVTSIDDFAFYLCEGLTEAIIPASVTSIGFMAFADCGDVILRVQAGSAAEQYAKEQGVSFANQAADGSWEVSSSAISSEGFEGVLLDGGVILMGYTQAPSGEFVIPSELEGYPVTGMDKGIFWSCNDMTSVIIPGSIAGVNDAAFAWCESLTHVTIEEGVTSIGLQTFEGCGGLTEVVLPETMTVIEFVSFADCASLTNLVIPASVTTIGEEAFKGCDNLTLTVTAGSVAEQYAKDNGIPYEYIQ